MSYEPPEADHARWATNMKRALELEQTLGPSDVSWLLSATGTKLSEHSAVAMCDTVIKRWVLKQVTERLKS